MKQRAKSILILSGGLDSSICAYILKNEKKNIYCLTFDYNQVARKELISAAQIAELIGAIEHKVLKIDLNQICNSKLIIENNILASSKHISTYVPARNIIFLAFAAAYAETIGANEIVIGTDQIDGGLYADCRLDFMTAFEKAIALGCNAYADKKNDIHIYLPLVYKRKEENLMEGIKLGVPFEKTWSCYENYELHCGKCRNCNDRRNAFKLAKMHDPTKYLCQ